MKQHRGVVAAKNGMVAASQPLAVSAGLAVLLKGGSFIDAAIATSAVLTVTEPYNSHLGGDAFLIVYEKATGKTTALNGSGAAPEASSLAAFPNGIPLRGLSAASVPGLVKMWETIHAKWGRLPFADLLAAAIEYAGQGVPLSYRASRVFQSQEALLRRFPDTALQLLPNGTLPDPGDLLIQPALARTLEKIASGGAREFYEGEIADRILRYSAENGGMFSAQDFTAHRTQVSDPIRTEYRGYTVQGQPPVSQGHILLQMLNILEGYPLSDWGHNSAEAIHVQVEAKKRAFADKAEFLGDPDFVEMPLALLLSKEYAANRRAQINRERALRFSSAPAETDHDTTYFLVADGEGNAVSFIQSVFWGFGCGVMIPDTGVLFNNRMTGFSLDPLSPNVLVPGKRTAHTLNAYLITKKPSVKTQNTEFQNTELQNSEYEELAWVGGTPGGDVQVQSNAQVILNVVDFGMNPQEAVEAARWLHGPAVGAPGETGAGVLALENRVSESVLGELRSLGHDVESLDAWGHASSYQLLEVQPQSGVLLGGSDPRCDGHAAGF